jgi:hypothetical protein
VKKLLFQVRKDAIGFRLNKEGPETRPVFPCALVRRLSTID